MTIVSWEFESPPLHHLFFFVAEIAQLVEHDLAKVGVAGPSPVFRSFLFVIEKHAYYEFIFEIFRSRDICYKC